MQRSLSLRPLSHDHHQGLALAYRIRQALHDGVAVGVLARQVVEFWHGHLIRHFADEDVLLSVLQVLEANALADRLLAEHAHIKTLVDRLEHLPEQVDELTAFIEALQTHIRFEERMLLPYIERCVPSVVLEQIGALLHEARNDA